jgi:uncharacterized CHY-type Zn-finger protein
MARQTTHTPAHDPRFAVPLRGQAADDETRCAHWDDPVDVVALRFACCETYYPCFTAERHPSGGDACPHCGAPFNPGCHDHRHLYFEASDDSG